MVARATRERKARHGDAMWGKGRARRTGEAGPDRRIMQPDVSVKSRDKEDCMKCLVTTLPQSHVPLFE